jgi:hypothetical protein
MTAFILSWFGCGIFVLTCGFFIDDDSDTTLEEALLIVLSGYISVIALVSVSIKKFRETWGKIVIKKATNKKTNQEK